MSLKRLLPLFYVAFLVSCGIHATTQASEGNVEFDTSKDGKVVVKIDGEQVAQYVYQDDDISRPYFAHLRTPDSPQISRNYPPIEGKDRADHGTFHPGLWMSFGDISGNDYWRLAAPVKQIAMKAAPEKNSFTVNNRYLDQDDPSQAVCDEECTYTVIPRPEGYLLLWDSTFSSDKEFYFGDQEEMGIGFRVATPIRVETEAAGNIPPGNGKMVDSEGHVNGDEIWGNTADWCDYSGTLDGQQVGMTLFCHPDNFRPSWFHARDYGLLEANPFGREAFGKGEKSQVDVKPGEKLRLRYGVFVHASPEGESPNLAEEYANYVEVAD
ncbi:DUF6807 family protein [Bythopirellula polymerisocia]|uniref:Secreted protein n=1 Tax=Bythopirellula polymerisocia TaxID=2528003 RepID=A0A5C6CZ04_9BACT|nr:DUF6807 family protein [Bythopirellula polymerisocia]TWU27879.1 hypothetical protein Pla144_26560 [Bythopirellula polymerisocia]